MLNRSENSLRSLLEVLVFSASTLITAEGCDKLEAKNTHLNTPEILSFYYETFKMNEVSDGAEYSAV